MPAYVLMKAFENAPARYDGAMGLLTLGRIGRLKAEIATSLGRAGARVLELGCGTGDLAVMLARAGAEVLALDSSEAMLARARERAALAGCAERIEFRHLSVMEIDSLPRGSFDGVVATLVLSELSDEEIEFVLGEARALLKPEGRVVVGDEVTPRGRFRHWGYGLLRFPLRLATYLMTQAQTLTSAGWARTALYFTIELPLMLLVFFFVPPPSRPLRGIEHALERAGFRQTHTRDYLGGTLKLMCAEVD